LNDHAFTTPTWAIKPEVLRRIEPSGVLDRIKTSQQRVLSSLMSSTRFARLVEQEAIDGATAYRPTDFLVDVRKGIWRELDAATVRIDAYRRNLQRAYLEIMADKLNGRQAVTDDQRPFIRGELRALDVSIRSALAQVADRATRLHLEDARDQVAKTLDPKFAPPAPTTQTLPFGIPGLDEATDPLGDETPLGCWPDYAVRPSGR
jgi:hypothetical protein